jgi:SecY interacting protein Syd
MPEFHPSIFDVLDTYVERALVLASKSEGSLFRIELDPAHPSPCDLDDADEEGFVSWRPVRRQPPGDFSSVEEAAGEPLHPDAKEFLGGFWAYGFEVPLEDFLSFLPAFCSDERSWERLLPGLRSHVMAKRQQKQPLTVFIGNTTDDRFFSIENATGRVLLEDFGPPPIVMAPTLVDFLSRLPPPAGL